jgi:outer membrane protein TolC
VTRTAPIALGLVLFAANVLAQTSASPSSLATPAVQSDPGQPSGPAPLRLTLDQAIHDAISAAPALQALGAQELAARWRVTAASRSRYGQADALAGYSRFQDDQIVRPMAVQLFGPGGFAALPWDRDQVHYGLTYQVPLYQGGRLTASIALSALQADQAALLVSGTRWDLQANVTALYTTRQSLEQLTAATRENLKALEATDQRVTLMVRQGKRPNLDLLKIQDEVQAARAQASALAADIARVDALLLAATGRDPGSVALVVDGWSDREPHLTIDDRAAVRLAAGSSPVRRATLAVSQAAEGIRLAKGTRYPSVALRGTVMGNAGLSLGEQFGTWELAVVASIPVFDGGTRAAGVAGAKAAEQAAAATLTRTRLEREAQAADALARFRAAGDGVVSAVARVASATEAARIEQVRYDQGAGTVEDLLRARARELAAQGALAQAQGGRLAAAAQINALCEKEVVQ